MDVRAARRGASPVRAHYPGGNVRGRQTPSGARPNRGAMTWPASLPGRLLEAAGNRGPRGMTVAGRKLRTEPGLQTGFANSCSFCSFCAFRRYGPPSSDRPRRRRRMPASGEVAPRAAPAGASACTFATVGSSGGGSLGRRCRPAGPRWPGPPAFPRTDRRHRWENPTSAARSRRLFFMSFACVLRRNMSLSRARELKVKS